MPTRPTSRLALMLAGATALAFVATACSGTDSPPAKSAATATATPTTAAAAPATPATTSTGATATATGTPVPSATSTPGATGATGAQARAKVSANTASRAEIQTALEAAGVPNAANWTREVLEYRPYPADDANLGKLRQNLAKYNPGPGVVDAIVSALKP